MKHRTLFVLFWYVYHTYVLLLSATDFKQKMKHEDKCDPVQRMLKELSKTSATEEENTMFDDGEMSISTKHKGAIGAPLMYFEIFSNTV